MERSLNLLRTRWAAIGAAVAVTLGAGGLGLVEATTTSGERTVLTTITSCRLTDTRSTDVDPRATPLQPGETYVLTAHGTNGQCTIPTNAVALDLNITTTDATELTFLTVWGQGTQPNASTLNPAPNQPPTPNSTTVDLSPTGTFNIFNFTGTVNTIVDITGYYTDHNHDDRYYTESESDARYARADGVTYCQAAAFLPENSGFGYSGAATRFGTGAGSYNMACQLDLPIGSTITRVRAMYIDNDAGLGARCFLKTTSRTAGEIAGVVTVATTDTTQGASIGLQEVSTTTIGDPVVTANETHHVSCVVSAAAGIHSVVIDHTLG